MGQAANGNLDDNLFMLAAIAGVTALYARITRVNLMRKFSALFIVISYAAVQFFLANIPPMPRMSFPGSPDATEHLRKG